MIVDVTFKTPDAVDDAIEREIEYTSENEIEIEKVKQFIYKFVKYGECLTVRFNTTNQTVEVLT